MPSFSLYAGLLLLLLSVGPRDCDAFVPSGFGDDFAGGLTKTSRFTQANGAATLMEQVGKGTTSSAKLAHLVPKQQLPGSAGNVLADATKVSPLDQLNPMTRSSTFAGPKPPPRAALTRASTSGEDLVQGSAVRHIADPPGGKPAQQMADAKKGALAAEEVGAPKIVTDQRPKESLPSNPPSTSRSLFIQERADKALILVNGKLAPRGSIVVDRSLEEGVVLPLARSSDATMH